MPRAANALLLLGDSSSAGIGCAVGVRDRAWRETGSHAGCCFRPGRYLGTATAGACRCCFSDSRVRCRARASDRNRGNVQAACAFVWRRPRRQYHEWAYDFIARSCEQVRVADPAPKQFVGTGREVGRQVGFRWSLVISLSGNRAVRSSEPDETRLGITARREEVFVGICRVRPATVPVEQRRSTAVGPRSRACGQASPGIPGA